MGALADGRNYMGLAGSVNGLLARKYGYWKVRFAPAANARA
jgi:hypothetical protein